MQIAALAIAEHPGEFENPVLARRQQLLTGEFRRGAQIARQPLAAGSGEFGPRGVEMGLVAGRDLENRGLDLDKTLLLEPGPNRLGHRAPRHQKRPDIGMPRR